MTSELDECPLCSGIPGQCPCEPSLKSQQPTGDDSIVSHENNSSDTATTNGADAEAGVTTTHGLSLIHI